MYEEGDGVGMALCITRSAFPDIYASAVERIRSGATYSELDNLICGEISEWAGRSEAKSASEGKISVGKSVSFSL